MEELDAVRAYRELEFVPDGEMGFDPGGREVKDAADAALGELQAKLAASEAELAAVREVLGGPDCPCTVENLSGRLKEVEHLGYQCGVTYQERALFAAEERVRELEAERDRMAVCDHAAWTGVDQNEGPDKVWRCDGCGFTFRHESHPDEGWEGMVAARLTAPEPK